MSKTKEIHQWTDNGPEVLILKCVPKDGIVEGQRDQRMQAEHGETYRFAWPLTVGTTVEAEDWDPQPSCGGGLHGWPWGLSIGDGKEADWQGTWLVFGALPVDVIDLGGKVKAHRGTIRLVGNWHDALMFVLAGQMRLVAARASSSAASSGDRSSAASSGASSSAASSGYRSSAASSGYSSSAASSGASSSAASSGDSSSAASSGLCSPAVCAGIESRAKAGEYGCIALAWWNEKQNRAEMRCERTGPGRGLLKPHVWYRLNKRGQFVEDK